MASIHFAVSLTGKKPADAFAKARKAAGAVGEHLKSLQIDEARTSRVALSEKLRFQNGVERREGYTAKIGFNVLLRNLDQVEELLIGAVDAGANSIEGVEFQTSRLMEHRAEARRRAVEAARDKAGHYCKAAGVQLGRVLHIEDVNPDVLTGKREGHIMIQVEPDDSGEFSAIDPGAIAIGGAVQVAFAIED